MKNNKSGFAFIPILIALSLLIAGGGVGVVITKKFYTAPSDLSAASLITADSYETSMEIVPDSQQTNAFENNSSEVIADVIKDVDENKSTNTKGDDMMQKNVIAPQIVEIYKSTPEEVDMVKSSIIEVKTDPVPVADSTEDLLLKISYEKTKTVSRGLTEGIEFVENRYNELLEFRDRGLELCKSSYEMDVSSVKSQADNLRQTYLESRTGYGTQPALINEIDRALEIDLSRIEDEYEICKTQYTVDSSVVRDIKAIKNEQSNILTSLTLENAVSSWENMLALNNKLLTIADKLR